MFQYALALALQRQGKRVLLDVSSYGKKNMHNGYQLEDIFQINAEYAPLKITKTYLKKRKTLSAKVAKHFFKRFLTKHYVQKIHNSFDYSSNTFIYSLNDAYLAGVWQSEKFFLSVKDDIKNIYSLDNIKISMENQRVLGEIRGTESVSLHVRRGDYVGHRHLGDICTPDYYRKSIQKMKVLEKPHFFVFSDDIQWCKKKIHIEEPTTYVDWNSGNNCHIDLYLMSQCKHNVIANSSFSWWGAYLNSHENKTVIAPSRWFQGENINDKDIYQKDWLRIDGQSNC